MFHSLLTKVVEGQHLTRAEAEIVMGELMNGSATDAQIGALLVALRMKGEQPEEVAGFAAVMRQKSERVVSAIPESVLDIVGTGGDGKSTFNISTLAALTAAGAGIPVAKHGNRSVSSKCGSADVLKQLGVNLDLTANQLSQCLEETGIAFLFAPRLHPAMKHAIGPRRELKLRTVFNMLGPITNPAGVQRQMIGVFSVEVARLLARVLKQLDARHILLVHSDDGMDEISLATETTVIELKDNRISEYKIGPEDFGIQRSDGDVTGGEAEENAEIARRILGGQKGSARDIVILNAAAGIYAAGATDDLKSAANIAAHSLDSGAAAKCLERLASISQELATQKRRATA